LKIDESLSLTDCQQFREWLVENHQIKKEIWQVIYKKSSGKPTISYNEAVEEALCFGWVDCMVKSIDAENMSSASPRAVEFPTGLKPTKQKPADLSRKEK